MNAIRTWLKGRLVSDWRSAWKWLSVQLALVASLAVGWLFAYPEIILSTINMLPVEARAMVSPVVSFVLFALVLAARLWKQRKPKG